MPYSLRTGIVAGRSHILDGRNYQDALCSSLCEVNGQPYIIGIIADGCGEGKYSEVGAQLAVQFVVREIRHLLMLHVPYEDIPAQLFPNVLHFLKTLVDSYHFAEVAEFVQFINHHLLFTLIGCVVGPAQTLVFAAGDGVVIINDDIHLREQHNTPTYIGYHLIDRRYLATNASVLPTTFDVYRLPTADLRRLAIGSDAWIAEQELLADIWGFPHVAGLQLQMNRWSAARHLKDDASLLVLERGKEAADER